MNTGIPLDHFDNVPPGTGKTSVMVNPEWWASLTEEQREFHTRHELLHAAVRAEGYRVAIKKFAELLQGNN